MVVATSEGSLAASHHASPERVDVSPGTEERGGARTPCAAEALAMSTRKSEPDSPLHSEATPRVLQGAPASLIISSETHVAALVEDESVRPRIKLLFRELQRLQGARAHAVWPSKKNGNDVKPKIAGK